MNKRQHWVIMAVWAAVLAVAVILFWDRLFPESVARPAPKAAGKTPVQAAATADPRTSLEAAGSPRVHLRQALRAKNPGYNGGGKFLEQDGKIVVADLSSTGIVDLSPLSQVPLEALDLKGNPLSDLAPLKGRALHKLAVESTKVTDLSPLAGMPLAELYANSTPVRDLSPLKGLPLNVLNLYETAVEDLSPLAGMPLKSLWLNGTRVKDLSPLRGCPLVSLTVERTPVADLSPLAGGKLERLHVAQTSVTDLTPLKGLPLTRLIFTPGRVKQGLEVVREMPSIRELGTTLDGRMPPEQFWKLYDAGKLEQAP